MTTSTLHPYRELLPNGEMRHNMHYGQIAVMMSKAREILALSGVQSGKTTVGVDWLDREIQEKGEGDYLMVSATYPLMQLKLLPEFLDVFQTMEHKGRWKEADKVFEFTRGKTRVMFGTATNPESLESATAKAAVADEAGQKQFRREAREALLRRLGIHKGRILYPTTPYQLGWLKSELYDRAKEPGSDIEVISWPSTANPAFPQEEFERARKIMPGWKFRMFYEGKFERPAGLIYDAFDERTCKVPRFPIPTTWPRYVGHDFGTANPAAMFYAQDPATGYFYAYAEYKPGPGRSTREHVQEFKRLTEGVNVMKRAGGSHQEEEIRAAYMAHGWFIQEPKIHDVAAGIDRVYALHKLNKLFVFDDLQKYLDEKLSYSYALNDKYEPTDDIEDKSSYHLCLVAGTLVRTQRGEIPIEAITALDKVVTRQGYQQVKSCGMTMREAKVSTVSLSNGRTLIGTPNHPVWVQDKGFVPLDTLRYGDIMETWEQKQLSSKALPIIFTQTHGGGQTGFISVGKASDYTELYGRMLTALFRKGLSSITRTATRWITPWRTWNFSQYLSIWLSTGSDGVTTQNILPIFAPWQFFGIVPPKDSLGTPNMERHHGSLVHWLLKAVAAAANLIRPSNRPIASSVDQLVKPPPFVYVVGMKRRGKAAVYNLCVEDAHEYYANGILVSNCDAERYILSDFTPELVEGEEQFFTMKIFGGEHKRSHGHLKKAARR